MIQKNRVIKVNRGYWEIFDGEKLVRGIINNSYLGKTMPVVGDFVVTSKIDDTKVLILDVQERKNELVKEYDEKNLKITKSLNNGKQIVAANIDVVFIVSSLNNEFNIGKIERLLILADLKNAKRCLVLSKKDLCKDYETYVKEITERFPQLQVILTSIVTGEGKDEIFEYWKPRQTAIFIGSSGVGKSSLVNMLSGEQKAKTGEIRMRDDKGKHTTSASTLFEIYDRFVIDTPGVREVSLTNVNGESLGDIFSKIEEIAEDCEYSSCTHTKEKGCAVRRAVREGKLDISEVERYLKLKNQKRKILGKRVQPDMYKSKLKSKQVKTYKRNNKINFDEE